MSEIARHFVRVGCSGWSYGTWRPLFYPEKTPLKKLLEAYASRLPVVEVNYTFRSTPSASTVANWLAQTPATFQFAFKAPQRITHVLRLRNALPALTAFALALAPVQAAGRMGPVLFQLPPNFKRDISRLADFLAEAQPLQLSIAWEFRDPSWFNDDVYALLKAHRAALCAAESDTLQSPDLALAPHLRVFRLRRSAYSHADLTKLAKRFTSMARDGEAVYAFFMHEDEPSGPLRALEVLDQIPPELRA